MYNVYSTIFVADHKGMVGSAILRELKSKGFQNILTADRSLVDLTNQSEVNHYFENHKIDYIFIAAAKVGGINANNIYPADFIYQNLMIECHLIHAAFKHGIQDLLLLGSRTLKKL